MAQTDQGFIFAASGDDHIRLAIKAAQSVRAVCPGIPIDLFTESPLNSTAFDEVHILPPGNRPKIPALQNSRFTHTVYLDSDILMVADCSDIFELLQSHDLAFVHDQLRNSGPGLRTWRISVPAAFPQLNGGLVGFRKSDATGQFFKDWAAAVSEHGAGVDQPSLRELLWKDQSLRVAILPEDYNLWDLKRIDRMDARHTAPRIIHSNLYKRPRVIERNGNELPLVLGHARAARLEMLLAADHTLNKGNPPQRPGLSMRLKLLMLKLRDAPRWFLNRLGRPYP